MVLGDVSIILCAGYSLSPLAGVKAKVCWTGTGMGPSLFGGGPVHLNGLFVVLGASEGRFVIVKMLRDLMLVASASGCW